MEKRRIALAADHAGYEIKEIIKHYLHQAGYDVKDFGTYSDESTDYPDYAHPLAESIESGECNLGFTFCGSGNGINMTVNKHQGIRSALCWNEEIAALARQHNDANVCSIPARFVSAEIALNIAKTFISSEFEGGRHKRRVSKISWGS
ncbi:MAG: ribose 5-phosphate isomerase B [Bacteroidales bacterium]